MRFLSFLSSAPSLRASLALNRYDPDGSLDPQRGQAVAVNEMCHPQSWQEMSSVAPINRHPFLVVQAQARLSALSVTLDLVVFLNITFFLGSEQ
jgi:hypothetical protein